MLAAVVVSAGVFTAAGVQAAPVVVPACGPVVSTSVSYVEVCGYTGGPQQFVVPAGVTTVGVTVDGASGAPAGGLGGVTTALLHVRPGEVLTVRVGQRGADGGRSAYGGGGDANFGGGGGGSFVDDGGQLLLAAGGGGGSAALRYGGGGSGAGLPAGSGLPAPQGGAGATSAGPGPAASAEQVSGTGPAGLNLFGVGGGGGIVSFGGGGGYYGGASGGLGDGGGGGGSGYASRDAGLVSGVSGSVGTAPAGDGRVVFSWLGPLAGFTLSPVSAMVGLGQSQQYTISSAVDAAGHLVPIGAVTFTISGGTCAGTVCTPSSAGPHTVSATETGGVRASAALTVTRGSTVTTLSSTTLIPGPGQALTLTATITPLPPATAGLVAPTGSVLFLIDGTPAGSATLNNGAATFSSAFPTLAPGPHTVTAVYGGDTNYLPSTSTTAIPVLTGCTQIINGATITGTHTGGLTVPAGGVLCVVSAHVSGGISIGRGASLFLTGSTLAGSVSASNPDRVQLCASTTSTIAVAGASGAVQIGDPSHGCAPNTIHGAVILTRDHGGLTLINNTITGSVTTVANTTQTITGNHH